MRRVLPCLVLLAVVALPFRLIPNDAGAADATVVAEVCTPKASTGLPLINDLALTSARSFTLTSGGTSPSCPRPLSAYKWLTINTAYTLATSGVLTWTCTGGPSSAEAIYALTTCTTVAGTCTLNMAGIMKTGTLLASTNYQAGPIQTGGNLAIKCTLTHSGAAAGDKVTANPVLRTGN